MLLSLGLYWVALNPRMAGFDVQNNRVTQSFRQTPSHTYQVPAVESDSSANVWGASEAGRIDCESWYKARKGDTQWDLAAKYATQNNKWEWIKTMRRVSGKSADDDKLRAGEAICVSW